MHSPVIFRAARAFHRRGYATLRFNFRGVGLSAGSFDGGRGEKEDVRAVLETLAGRLPGMPIALVGYSFGSQVGFEAAGDDPRVHRLVGMGLPVSMGAVDFLKRIPEALVFDHGS